jgi:hypothetical protein
VYQRNEGGTAGGVTAGVSAGAVVVEVVDVVVTVGAPPPVSETVVEVVPVDTGLGCTPHSDSSFWTSATVGLRMMIWLADFLPKCPHETRSRAARLLAAETGNFQFMMEQF